MILLKNLIFPNALNSLMRTFLIVLELAIEMMKNKVNRFIKNPKITIHLVAGVKLSVNLPQKNKEAIAYVLVAIIKAMKLDKHIPVAWAAVIPF